MRDIVIGGVTVGAGQSIDIDLPVGTLYTHAQMTIPLRVIRSRRPGPTLFVSGAIHGDELNGLEIIRRLLKGTAIKRLRGTLIAVPAVNVHGLIQRSRYLPDRRDLNRSFPGSERGSLAARMADLFLSEVVDHCDYGIDLHTAAIHRENLPQIRADLDDPETARLARAFGAPVIIDSDLRDGSLRETAVSRGTPILLYEAGEALRFDELSIRAGVHGVISVMRELQMLPAVRKRRIPAEPTVSRSSLWVRAPIGGIFRSLVPLGKRVARGDELGVVGDLFGEAEESIQAPASGIVIGRGTLPLASEGEALYHIARFHDSREVETQVERFQEEHQRSNPIDEPPLI